MQITQDLINRIKQNEGTKEYQIVLGYFRNKRFHVYKCTAGKRTIGYGHNAESEIAKDPKAYKDGITEAEADALLYSDIQTAVMQAETHFNIQDHSQAIQDLITEMIFQLGITTANKFKRFKLALTRNDYKAAAIELKDSNWYKQTPKRVQTHIEVLNAE